MPPQESSSRHSARRRGGIRERGDNPAAKHRCTPAHDRFAKRDDHAAFLTCWKSFHGGPSACLFTPGVHTCLPILRWQFRCTSEINTLVCRQTTSQHSLTELETLRLRVSSTRNTSTKPMNSSRRAIEERDEDAGRNVARNAGKRLVDIAEHVGTSLLTKLLERMLGFGRIKGLADYPQRPACSADALD